MQQNNNIQPIYSPGERVTTTIYHPPQIFSGTWATIVSSRIGRLYIVRLPNGNPYRWMAEFELESIEPDNNNEFKIGDMVRIKTEAGHTPYIKKDMIARIETITPIIPYYDVMVRDLYYHRWLTETEIIPINT